MLTALALIMILNVYWTTSMISVYLNNPRDVDNIISVSP